MMSHSASTTLVFIDSAVLDSHLLTAGLKTGLEVLGLHPEQDGIEQITQALQHRRHLQALHIVSHGSPGSLQLGTTHLSLENLDQYQAQIQQWANSLADNADILLYGCHVAATAQGRTFIHKLSQLTQAQLAASDDPTGSSYLGGDWELEVTTGNIQTPLAFHPQVRQAYPHILNSDLFFSEYIEGTNNNKALEIYNPTNSTIDLSAYRILIYYNGSTTANPISGIALSGSIAPGETFVIANSSATTLGSIANQTSGSLSFNGNDAIVLTKIISGTTTIVDSIGQIGNPLITEWGTGLTSTTDNTLRRKATITIGDTNPFDVFNPSLQWEGFATDTFNGLDSNTVSNSINQAPILDNSGNPALSPIPQNIISSANTGTSVSQLIDGLIADGDQFDATGIAVTGVDNTNGTWQYSLNGGSSWNNFNTNVSDTNATLLLSNISLYNSAAGGTPDTQEWLIFNSAGVVPSQTVSSGVTTVNTITTTNYTTNESPITFAGYTNYKATSATKVNNNFPILDRTQGFTLSFEVQVNQEAHFSDDNSDGLQDRAGFNIIVVTNDKKAIELGFWTDEIWAQNDGSGGTALFTHSSTERAFFNTTGMTSYDLTIKGSTYTLLANGVQILTGNLRDYSAFNSVGAGLPYDPYETSNFLFFGDNSSSAGANYSVKNIDLKFDTRVRFVPNDGYIGTSDFKFRAWDGTDGKTSGATGVNVDINGGSTAYSASNESVSIEMITVTPVEVGIEAIDNLAFESDSSNTGIFRITRTGSTTGELTVNLGVDASSTTSASDYTLSSGGLSVVIPDGQSYVDVALTAVDDTLPENAESLKLNLVSGTGYAINSSKNTATVSIAANNAISYEIAASAVTVNEGTTGDSSVVTFTVTRSGGIGVASTVNYALGGSATAGIDYNDVLVSGGSTATSGTLSFEIGETTKTISLKVVGDNVFEADETIIATLSNPNLTTAPYNSAIATSTATATITNDDLKPVFSINSMPIFQDEGNSGTTNYVYTVTLSNPSDQTITVNYTTDDGKATVADGDYIDNDGVLTFTPGETSQTITVQVKGDNKVEDFEYFFVNLQSSSGADLVIGSTQSYGNIDNDDTAGFIVSPISGNTSESGGTATFTVKLSSQPTADVILGISSSNTAEGTISTSALTFTAANWNTAQTVTITGKDDSLIDGDINYQVVFGAASSSDSNYASITPSSLNLKNLDNDNLKIINGTAIAETITGTTGNDQMNGFGGNDIIIGGLGADRLYGGDGDDELTGDLKTTITGSFGSLDDLLDGGNGNDRLYGGLGNDTLFGSAGNDQMWGENGNDSLRGGLGNDTLFGGAGNDHFIFAKGEGIDTVRDFQLNIDKVGLVGLAFNDLKFQQSGSQSLMIDKMTNQTLAIFSNMTVSALNASANFTIISP